MTDDDLQVRLVQALSPAPVQPPADRVATLRARAERTRAHPGTAGGTDVPQDPFASPPAHRGRLLLALAAGVVVLVAAAAGGSVLTSGPAGSEQDLLARGTAEFEASLQTQDGVEVDVDGSRAPEGRIVVLESTTLPVLPTGEYYELWFVGPADAPGTPDRVSAGTFHPDYDDGDTLVVLHAAIDPTLFPEVEITSETGDGDPAASDVVVLRGPLDLLG